MVNMMVDEQAQQQIKILVLLAGADGGIGSYITTSFLGTILHLGSGETVVRYSLEAGNGGSGLSQGGGGGGRRW